MENLFLNLGSIKMSLQTSELFTALSKAQGEIETVEKDKSVNMSRDGRPGAKYKYAELSDVQAAIKEPFARNGLSYSQWLLSNGIATMIKHSSGQWICGELSNAEIQMRGSGPQDYGSLSTYLRRYHLAAAAGISQDDDDGNKAQGNDAQISHAKRETPKQLAAPTQAPSMQKDSVPEDKMQNFKTVEPSNASVISEAQVKRLFAIAKKHNYGTQDLKIILKESMGIDSTSQIPCVKYDTLVNLIQMQTPSNEIIEKVLIKHGGF